MNSRLKRVVGGGIVAGLALAVWAGVHTVAPAEAAVTLDDQFNNIATNSTNAQDFETTNDPFCPRWFGLPGVGQRRHQRSRHAAAGRHRDLHRRRHRDLHRRRHHRPRRDGDVDQHDSIQGGEGNDKLFGGAGDDAISGPPGIDAANGGSGYDRCISRTNTACEAAQIA